MNPGSSHGEHDSRVVEDDIETLTKQFEEDSLAAFKLKSRFEEIAQKLYDTEKRINQLKEQKAQEMTDAPVAESSDAPSTEASTSSSDPAHAAALPSFIRHAAKRARVNKAVRTDDNHLLSRVAIALVRPEGSINVGMISRLAANLGVTDIRLVAPQCSHTNSDGRRFAHHALPLLSSLPTYDTIEECAADCKFVIGSSARDCANVLRGCSFIEPQEIALACIREQLWGPDAVEEDDDASGRESKRSRTAGASPADASDDDDELLDAGKGAAMSLLAEVRRRPRQRFVSRGPRVLLLFGNESTGLTHAELSMAKYCVYIPTRGAYPSLNLAQAVTALLFTLWVTGHTHTYWPGVASTGVGLGSGVFDRDSVKMMLGLPDASSGEAGAASAAPSSTNAHMRRQTQLKPASVTQVERLRATLEATMARWGYKPAVLWPHKWHDSTHRIARQLTGALSEGDANLVFGLLSTFNSHPTAAALPPLEVAPPQGSVAPVETAADDKPTTN